MMHSSSQEDQFNPPSSDSRKCMSEQSESNSFHPFQNFKTIQQVIFHKKQPDQQSDLKPPTLLSYEHNSKVNGISQQKIKLDQSEHLPQVDQLIIPQENEQLVSQTPQKHFTIQEINTPSQSVNEKYGNKSNMNFIQLLLTKRIINNFKDNLFSSTYILPKKISVTLKKLLDEEYIKKKEKIKKNKKQKQFKIQKVSKGITQFLKFGIKPKKRKIKINVFDPTSKIIIIWEAIKIFFIILFFWWVPFQLSFQAEITNSIKSIQLFVLVFFSLDIIIKLNKAYISLGQIVRERKQIFLHYISSEALVDCSSLMCISIYIRFQDAFSRLLICFILIIYFFLNISKINRSLSKITESFYFQNQISESLALVKLILVIFFFAHIIACIWHFVGSLSKQTGISWITAYQLENEQIWTLYNYSFYWATMTMVTVGYGDITPKNNYELICANMTMFVACGVFAFSINAIGIVLQNINEGKAKFKRTLNLINSYMNKNQVHFEMQSRVRNYLEYCFDQENEINDEEVTDQFTQICRFKTLFKNYLLYSVLSKDIQNCKVISSNFSESTQKAIAYRMESYRISPQEKIICVQLINFSYFVKQDQIDDCSLYIIQKGEVKIIEEKSKKVLKILKKGESFGEYSFFTGLARTCSVMSEDFSRVYKIPRNVFLEVISDDQEEKVENYFIYMQESFHQIKDLIQFSSKYDYANMKCFVCQKQNHLSVKCPKLHYMPDLEKLIKSEYFPNSERQKYIRKLKKSSIKHSLANLKVIQEQGKGIADQYLFNEQILEEEESEKSNNHTNTNIISMINSLEQDNKLGYQISQYILSDKKLDETSDLAAVRSSQQKGTAEFKMRNSSDDLGQSDSSSKGKIQFLKVVEDDHIGSKQKIIDLEVDGKTPQESSRQGRKKKTIKQDDGLKSPMRPSIKQNARKKTFMQLNIPQIDEQNEEQLTQENQNPLGVRRISTHKVTQPSFKRDSSPQPIKYKEKTQVSKSSLQNDEFLEEITCLSDEQEICSFDIDQMQLYKIYFPFFNYDVICRKMLKMQIKMPPIKKNYQISFQSGKYTFYSVVKKRAQKLRYYIKKHQLGISESKFASPKQQNLVEKYSINKRSKNFLHINTQNNDRKFISISNSRND